MKILIVNCFKSRESFQRFLSFITGYLKTSCLKTVSSFNHDVEFIIRTKSELSDFLVDYDDQ